MFGTAELSSGKGDEVVLARPFEVGPNEDFEKAGTPSSGVSGPVAAETSFQDTVVTEVVPFSVLLTEGADMQQRLTVETPEILMITPLCNSIAACSSEGRSRTEAQNTFWSGVSGSVFPERQFQDIVNSGAAPVPVQMLERTETSQVLEAEMSRQEAGSLENNSYEAGGGEGINVNSLDYLLRDISADILGT